MQQALLQRRRLLQAAAAAVGACALPRLAFAGSSGAAGGGTAAAAGRVFAAWDLPDGRHQVGCLALAGPDGAGCQVLAALDVPTRAHGLLPLPDGGVLVAARRPGDWLLRWHPAQPAAAQWHWIDGDRAFNGHVQPLGGHFYTTESDLESGTGLLVRRDAATLERLAEWSTGGVDNHALLPDGRGGLFVANGGVATRPETGRLKIDLDRMDSSIVRIDAATGALSHQWRLADRRLSLRHLAWRGDDLGIALQAQHEPVEQQRQAPVLALLRQVRSQPDAAVLVAVPAPQALGGYGGDLCASADGWFVSCPRVNAVACWSDAGAWLGSRPHTEAYALVAAGGMPWVAGPLGWRALAGDTPASHPWQAAREPDNHAAWSPANA